MDLCPRVFLKLKKKLSIYLIEAMELTKISKTLSKFNENYQYIYISL